MPAQLSTILYISSFTETISPNYFLGAATGIARLGEGDDEVQIFNITIFYPVDSSIQCYVPRLKSQQVISVNNCKFSKGDDNKIDVNNKKYIYAFFKNLLFVIYFINFFFSNSSL